MKDDEFASMWASGRVSDAPAASSSSTTRWSVSCLRSPSCGCQADSPDHRLEVYTAADQMSADAMTLLDTLTHEGNLGEASGRSATTGYTATPPRASDDASDTGAV